MATTLLHHLDDLFHHTLFGDAKKLAISLPPGHGKTESIVRMVTSYLAARPRKRVMLSSYSRDQARAVVNRIWRESGCVSSARVPVPVGAGGALTGHGFDLVVLDDLIKSTEEAFPERLAQLWSWLETVPLCRMLAGARVVLVCSRRHAHDPFGRIAMGHAGEGWTLVNIPAIAELGDPLGRRFGDPLLPDAVPGQALQGIRRGIGLEHWMGLYQGHPDGDGFPVPEPDTLVPRRGQVPRIR